MEIIETHEPDTPLFLFVAYQAVHSPLEVPEQYTAQYKDIKNSARRTYAGMVSCMDEGIGNITRALQNRGLWEDTVLFFSTDNGGQVYEGGNNWPLRGWKGSLWEGGMRGVGFVYSKMLDRPGQINSEMIHVTDWFPTMVHLAGGSVDGIPLDGYNVWETLSSGKPSPRKEMLHNIDPVDAYWDWDGLYEPYQHFRQAAIRVGDWKLLTGCPGNGSWVPPAESFYPIKHSPNLFDNINSTFLFNIREDPEERNELSEVYPEMVSLLMKRLKEFNATAVPVHYPDPDPASKPELHGNVWTPWVDSNI